MEGFELWHLVSTKLQVNSVEWTKLFLVEFLYEIDTFILNTKHRLETVVNVGGLNQKPNGSVIIGSKLAICKRAC